MPTITATADTATATVTLTIAGGTPDDQLLVVRRDDVGVQTLRATQDGSVTYDASGDATVVDYEARQGVETDYLLTTINGAVLASDNLTVPLWGSWLKHPGRPFLNTLVHFVQDESWERPAVREVIPIRGAQYPVVVAERRQAPTGTVTLLTLTDAQATALRAIVDDGQALMLDTPPRFGVPVRYISVGGFREVRAADSDVLLHVAARRWELSDVVTVATPVGVAAGQGFTFDALTASADTFASLTALYESFDDMTVGQTIFDA